MRYLALCVVVAVSACSFGAGTSMVGVWRPQRRVDTEVCIEEAPGRCARTVQVARDVPARSFGGGLLSFFNPGYGRVSLGSKTANQFVIDNAYEYLRGRGGLALGVRVGAMLGLGDSSYSFSMPVTVLGHWGYRAFSLYGGAGYTPFASTQVGPGEMDEPTHGHGFNLLGGARVLLRTNRTNKLSSSVEIVHQALGDASITSVTSAFGIHF